MTHISSINGLNDGFSEHYIPEIGKTSQHIPLLGTNVQKKSTKRLDMYKFLENLYIRAEFQVTS
jgi:hypothetical protein